MVNIYIYILTWYGQTLEEENISIYYTWTYVTITFICIYKKNVFRYAYTWLDIMTYLNLKILAIFMNANTIKIPYVCTYQSCSRGTQKQEVRDSVQIQFQPGRDMDTGWASLEWLYIWSFIDVCHMHLSMRFISMYLNNIYKYICVSMQA
jgi:hypothetical protein